jgi:hypothetical protein
MHQPSPSARQQQQHHGPIVDVLISPTFKALQQTNLLEIRPMGKSVIFRLPNDDRSPPTREERQRQQTMFRQMYSTPHVVSNDDDDDEGNYTRLHNNDIGNSDLLRPMNEYMTVQVDTPAVEGFQKYRRTSDKNKYMVEEDTFFSPIEPALTPSSTRTDTFYTPELASPTLLKDIQSSQSIRELQMLQQAFGSDYPSLSRRADARIQDLIMSPTSVLVGENLMTSPQATWSLSTGTSVVSLELSLSMEDEEELAFHQQQQYGKQACFRPNASKMLENAPSSKMNEYATFRSISDQYEMFIDGNGVSEIVPPTSNDNHEYEELLESVQELRNQNQALQTDIRTKVLERQQAMQDTKDTEQKLLSQIHFMQQSLAISSEQTERERKFFMQVQLNLNGRLKEAKQRLERVSRDREKMISGLKKLFATGHNNEVSTIEVDELIQKAAQSIQDHQDANRALTACLETAHKDIRSAKEVSCDIIVVLKFDLTESLRRNTSLKSS